MENQDNINSDLLALFQCKVLCCVVQKIDCTKLFDMQKPAMCV